MRRQRRPLALLGAVSVAMALTATPVAASTGPATQTVVAMTGTFANGTILSPFGGGQEFELVMASPQFASGSAPPAAST